MTAETETTNGNEAETAETETASSPTPDVAAMERALRKANKEAESARLKLKEREDADLSETERIKASAIEAEQKASDKIAAANKRIIRAEVKALAAGKLASPDLAAGLLNLSDFEVDDDGEVDTKAIEKALDKLIADHPELAAGAASRVPGVPAGARGTQPAPGDMNTLLRQAAGRG